MNYEKRLPLNPVQRANLFGGPQHGQLQTTTFRGTSHEKTVISSGEESLEESFEGELPGMNYEENIDIKPEVILDEGPTTSHFMDMPPRPQQVASTSALQPTPIATGYPHLRRFEKDSEEEVKKCIQDVQKSLDRLTEIFVLRGMIKDCVPLKNITEINISRTKFIAKTKEKNNIYINLKKQEESLLGKCFLNGKPRFKIPKTKQMLEVINKWLKDKAYQQFEGMNDFNRVLTIEKALTEKKKRNSKK